MLVAVGDRCVQVNVLLPCGQGALTSLPRTTIPYEEVQKVHNLSEILICSFVFLIHARACVCGCVGGGVKSDINLHFLCCQKYIW